MSNDNIIVFVGLIITLSIVIITLYFIFKIIRKKNLKERIEEHHKYLMNSIKPVNFTETDVLFKATQGHSLSFIKKQKKLGILSGLILEENQIYIPDNFIKDLLMKLKFKISLKNLQYDINDFKVKLIKNELDISKFFFSVDVKIVKFTLNYLIRSGRLIAYIIDNSLCLLEGYGLRILLNVMNSFDLEDFWQHLEYFDVWSERIFEYKIQNGEVPHKNEAIILGITEKYYDDAINYFNLQFDQAILPYLTIEEMEYFDALLKEIIKREPDLMELKLEDLILKTQVGMLNAKILIKYINEKINEKIELKWPLPNKDLDEIDEIVAEILQYINKLSKKKRKFNYLTILKQMKVTFNQLKLVNQYIRNMVEEPFHINFDYLGTEELDLLDELATQLIKSTKDIKNLNLTKLAIENNVSIHVMRKVVAYREWILDNYQLESLSYMSKSDIIAINKKLTDILKEVITNKKELSLSTLIFDHDIGLKESLIMLSFYEIVLKKELEFKYMLKSDRQKIQDRSEKIQEYINKEKLKKIQLDDLLMQFDYGLIEILDAMLYLQQVKQLNVQISVRKTIISKQNSKLTYTPIEFW